MNKGRQRLTIYLGRPNKTDFLALGPRLHPYLI